MSKFTNCYVKVTLKTLFTEVFDCKGRIKFVSIKSKDAVLHENQANNPAKVEEIKQLMWEELRNEQGWEDTFKEPLHKLCSFSTVSIPKKSAPITYKI